MRYSVISSLVANVVAQAIDCLVAAGLTVRTRLHHTSMRERHFNGQEPQGDPRLQEPRSQRSGWLQLSHARNCNLARLSGNPTGRGATGASSLWQGLFSKRSAQQAFAYCPAQAAIARAAHRG